MHCPRDSKAGVKVVRAAVWWLVCGVGVCESGEARQRGSQGAR